MSAPSLPTSLLSSNSSGDAAATTASSSSADVLPALHATGQPTTPGARDAEAGSAAPDQAAAGDDSTSATSKKFPPIDWVAGKYALEHKLIGLLHDFDSLRKVWFLQNGEACVSENKASAGKTLAALLLKDTPLWKHVENTKGDGRKLYGTRVVQKIDQKRGRGLSYLYKQMKDDMKITGNGVKNASDLNDESSNLWEEKKKKIPWFFEYASLVRGRLDIGAKAVSNSVSGNNEGVLSGKTSRKKKGKRMQEVVDEDDEWMDAEDDEEDAEDEDSEEENEEIEGGGEEGTGGKDGNNTEDKTTEEKKEVVGGSLGDGSQSNEAQNDHGAKRPARNVSNSTPSKRKRPIDVAAGMQQSQLDDKAEDRREKAESRRELIAFERAKQDGLLVLEEKKQDTEREKQETERLAIQRLQLQLQLRSG